MQAESIDFLPRRKLVRVHVNRLIQIKRKPQSSMKNVKETFPGFFGFWFVFKRPSNDIQDFRNAGDSKQIKENRRQRDTVGTRRENPLHPSPLPISSRGYRDTQRQTEKEEIQESLWNPPYQASRLKTTFPSRTWRLRRSLCCAGSIVEIGIALLYPISLSLFWSLNVEQINALGSANNSYWCKRKHVIGKLIAWLWAY